MYAGWRDHSHRMSRASDRGASGGSEDEVESTLIAPLTISEL